MQPSLDRIDHIHVYVADRDVAARWYETVMGLRPVPGLRAWAQDGGPLTLANASGSVHIALFERPAQPCRATIAFAVGAMSFLAWQRHLSAELSRQVEAVDHAMSWSLYFHDPDGNPYEITSYDHDTLREALRRA